MDCVGIIEDDYLVIYNVGFNDWVIEMVISLNF